MQKTIANTKDVIDVGTARGSLSNLLDKVYSQRKEFVIKSNNKPVAVLVPMSEYKKYQKQRQQHFEVYDRIWERNKDVDVQEAEQDISRAIEEVRDH